MTDGDVVLGSQIAALIVALHNSGVLSAGAVRDQLAAAVEFQPEHRQALLDAVQRVHMLVAALAPFEPRCPSAMHMG